MTLAEENYLKTIFHLEYDNPEEVSTNAIAEQMDTRPSSVTDMIQKLAEKNLLIYKPYRGVQLTSHGKKMAAGIIRKHRLWEVFLVEKLNFSWDQVHDIAEQLEHIQSEELIDRLDRYLGNPKTDPHGDPIPDKNGILKPTAKKLLTDLEKNQEGVCVGVKETGAEFLQYLDKMKIGIGTKIQVLDKEDFDNSMQILLHGQKKFISQKTAENLFIKTI